MFQTLSKTCLDSTLINKQVNYYICVCYHQDLILHKHGFNKEAACYELVGYPPGWNTRGHKGDCGRGRARKGGGDLSPGRKRGTATAAMDTTSPRHEPTYVAHN